ncbi:MAG: Smr/MutS family protein [Treponema sp.]|nr:Smr/MutS family protein [Treponema sp.]
MDFGAILDKWERQGSVLKDGVLKDGVPKDGLPKDGGRTGDALGAKAVAQDRRRRLKNKRPDAQIDLHGKTKEQAWLALDAFFRESARMGHEKLQVIHGKGNNSSGEAALRRLAMDFIERCPFAGESGYEDARSGGTGATWVLLKDAEKGR